MQTATGSGPQTPDIGQLVLHGHDVLPIHLEVLVNGLVPVLHEGATFRTVSPRNSWQARIVSLYVSGMPRPLCLQYLLGQVHETQDDVIDRLVQDVSNIAIRKVPVPIDPFNLPEKIFYGSVEKFQEAILSDSCGRPGPSEKDRLRLVQGSPGDLIVSFPVRFHKGNAFERLLHDKRRFFVIVQPEQFHGLLG